MAIPIEAFSVVIRNSTLGTKFPGGMDGYRLACPNKTFCADEHLSRVSFMVHRDAELFVADLATSGLTPLRNGIAEDVALVDANDVAVCNCAWLTFAMWGNVNIAWLTGTIKGNLYAPEGWSADRSMCYLTGDEAKQRLEFLRRENDVEVYRDKRTGKELYVGRTSADFEHNRSRHNALYEKGCELIKGLIAIGNSSPGRLQRGDRKRLEEAIPIFENVVQINSQNWAAMWLLGKIYQRLADYGRGLSWFTRAHHLKPDQPDVAREAAIAAMELGRPEEATEFCTRAIEASPDDAGLHANLALALLFSQKPGEALTAAQDSLRLDPSDEITRNIVTIIEEVLRAKRRCPRHSRDLS